VHSGSREKVLRLSLVSEDDVKKFQRFAQKFTSESNGPKPVAEEPETSMEEYIAQKPTGEQVNDHVLSEDEPNTQRPMVQATTSRETTTQESVIPEAAVPEASHSTPLTLRSHMVWYCCNCGDGPILCSTYTHCPNCHHQKCGYCGIEAL
jgi:hypothetical protein